MDAGMTPEVVCSLSRGADKVLEKNGKSGKASSIITYQRRKKVIHTYQRREKVIRTYQRRKKVIPIKTYQRKKRKSSCFLSNIMERVKVIQTVQNNPTGEVSVSWSGDESKGRKSNNNWDIKDELNSITEGCNVFCKGNLEVSVDGHKMEEMLPSCDVNIMKNNVSVGFIDKEANVLEKLPSLPRRSPHSSGRKLLILDLNGLLADIVPSFPRGYTPDKKFGCKSFFKRPYCDDFLKFCFERFEVGIWSSRNKRNVDSVIDFLMKDMKHKLLFCWDQSHCTETGFFTIENKRKPLVLKELKKLWDKHDLNLPWEKGVYNEFNTVLVDDSPYKALCNPPHTGIFPTPFTYRHMKDNSLGPGGDLRVYLEGLAMAEDVKKYVEEHPFGQVAITSKSPSWDFYHRVKTKIYDVRQKENVDGSSLTSGQELCKLSSR